MGVSATRPNMMMKHQASAPDPGMAATHSTRSPSPRNGASETQPIGRHGSGRRAAAPHHSSAPNTQGGGGAGEGPGKPARGGVAPIRAPAHQAAKGVGCSRGRPGRGSCRGRPPSPRKGCVDPGFGEVDLPSVAGDRRRNGATGDLGFARVRVRVGRKTARGGGGGDGWGLGRHHHGRSPVAAAAAGVRAWSRRDRRLDARSLPRRPHERPWGKLIIPTMVFAWCMELNSM
ncbi:hypothetical protein PAHAL_3G249700 [Panicum hallii]|uniref:Uncharacterized protein n=1 Tax=Panicum hallii TaxID=206008 RepID=A0A2S3HBB8_9POAL|nr:hypothetical protein PAHAL_3G249700 [Panicum hallii]